MKYLAVLTNNADDLAAWATLTPEQSAAARANEIPQWEALFAELGPLGVIGYSAELDSPSTAKTVRVRGGETVVTDGPFAETKEQIGGVMELEADDLDHAIGIAARIPTAASASVELRPVRER